MLRSKKSSMGRFVGGLMVGALLGSAPGVHAGLTIERTLSFDGTDRVTLPSNENLGYGVNRTVEGWMFLTPTTTNVRAVWGGQISSWKDSFMLYVQDNGAGSDALYLQRCNTNPSAPSGADCFTQYLTDVSFSRWNHFELRINDSNPYLQFFWDGVEQTLSGAGNAHWSQYTVDNSVYLGARSTTTNRFIGLLDEITISEGGTPLAHYDMETAGSTLVSTITAPELNGTITGALGYEYFPPIVGDGSSFNDVSDALPAGTVIGTLNVTNPAVAAIVDVRIGPGEHHANFDVFQDGNDWKLRFREGGEPAVYSNECIGLPTQTYDGRFWTETMVGVCLVDDAVPTTASVLELDGDISGAAASHVTLPGSQDLGFQSPGTVAGWFYADNLSANQEQVLWRADSMTATGLDIARVFLEDSKLKFSRRHYHTGTMSYSYSAGISSSNLVSNRWYHFGLVMDDSSSPKIRFYLDGVLLGSSDSAVMTASNNSVLLGVGIGYGGFVIVPLHPFDGKMDDVRIWERALTAEEMGTLRYQGALTGTWATDLRADYQMGPGASVVSQVNSPTVDGTLSHNAALGTYDLPRWDLGQSFAAENSNQPGQEIGPITHQNPAGSHLTFQVVPNTPNADAFELFFDEPAEVWKLHWSTTADPMAHTFSTLPVTVSLSDGRFTDTQTFSVTVAENDIPAVDDAYYWADLSAGPNGVVADLTLSDPDNDIITHVEVTSARIDCETDNVSCTHCSGEGCRVGLNAEVFKVEENTNVPGTFQLKWKENAGSLLGDDNFHRLFAFRSSPQSEPGLQDVWCNLQGYCETNYLCEQETLDFIEITLQVTDARGGVAEVNRRVGFIHTDPLPSFSSNTSCAVGETCTLNLPTWDISTHTGEDKYFEYKVADLITGAVSVEEFNAELGTDAAGDALGLGVWCDENCETGKWQYAADEDAAANDAWVNIESLSYSTCLYPFQYFCNTGSGQVPCCDVQDHIWHTTTKPYLLLPPEAVLRYVYDYANIPASEWFEPDLLHVRVWDQQVGRAFDYWDGDVPDHCARVPSLSEQTHVFDPNIYEPPSAPIIDENFSGAFVLEKCSAASDCATEEEPDRICTAGYCHANGTAAPTHHLIDAQFEDANLYDAHELSVAVDPAFAWAVTATANPISNRTNGAATGSFSFQVDVLDNFYGLVNLTVRITEVTDGALFDEKTIALEVGNRPDDLGLMDFGGRGFQAYDDPVAGGANVYLQLPSDQPELRFSALGTVETWLRPGSIIQPSRKYPVFTNHVNGLFVMTQSDVPQACSQTSDCYVGGCNTSTEPAVCALKPTIARLCLIQGEGSLSYCSTITEPLWSTWEPESLDQWMHVAMTLDEMEGGSGKTLRFYRDGQLLRMSGGVGETLVEFDDASVTIVDNPYETKTHSIAYSSGSLGANFQFDNFRLWQQERSQAQLQRHMFQMAPADEFGLVAQYDFNALDFVNGNPVINNLVEENNACGSEDPGVCLRATLTTCESGGCQAGLGPSGSLWVEKDTALTMQADADGLPQFYFPFSSWFEEQYGEAQAYPDLTIPEDESYPVQLYWHDPDNARTPQLEMAQAASSTNQGDVEVTGGTNPLGLFEIAPAADFEGVVTLETTLSYDDGTGNTVETNADFDVTVENTNDAPKALPQNEVPGCSGVASFTEGDANNACTVVVGDLFYDPDNNPSEIELDLELQQADGSYEPVALCNEPGLDLCFDVSGSNGIVDGDLTNFKIDIQGLVNYRCMVNGDERALVFKLTATDPEGGGDDQEVVVSVMGANDKPGLQPNVPQPLDFGPAIAENDTDTPGRMVSDFLPDWVFDDEDVLQANGQTCGGAPQMGLLATEVVRGAWQYQRNGEATWHFLSDELTVAGVTLAHNDKVRVLPDGQSGIADGALFRAKFWDGSMYSDDSVDFLLAVEELDGPVSRTGEDDPAILCPTWTENATDLLGSSNPSCAFNLETVYQVPAADDLYEVSLVSQPSGTGTVTWAQLDFQFDEPGKPAVVTGEADLDCLPLGQTVTQTVYLKAVDEGDRQALASVAIPVAGSNDSPLVGASLVALPDIDENSSDYVGELLNSLLAGVGQATDPDVCNDDPLLGLAVVGVSGSVWQYKPEGPAANWTDFSDASPSAAWLLPGNVRLRAKPNGETGAEASLEAYLWDMTAGWSAFTQRDVSAASHHGGVGTLSVDAVTLTQTVHEVTSPPVLLADNLEVSESASVGTAVGQPVSVQSDPDGGTYAYELMTAGTPFSLDAATGVLSVAAVLDFETTQTYSLAVDVIDGAERVTASFTVAVTNENDSVPVIGGCPSELVLHGAEAVGTDAYSGLSLSDADHVGGEADGPLALSMDPQAANPPLIVLDEAGGETLVINRDVEEYLEAGGARKFAIALRISDGQNEGVPCNIQITINQPPEIDVAAFASSWAILENEPAGTIIGAPAVAHDPEGDPITFHVYKYAGTNATNDHVAISEAGVLTANDSFDYEAPGPKTKTVWLDAFDGVFRSERVMVQVRVQDVDESPAFDEVAFSIPETAHILAPFTQITATDPEGAELEFSSVTHDVVDVRENGEVFLKFDPSSPSCAAFNAGCRPLYSLERLQTAGLPTTFNVLVTVTDGIHEKVSNVSFNVVAVEETPEFLEPSGQAWVYPRWLNPVVDTLHFDLAAVDPDAGDDTLLPVTVTGLAGSLPAVAVDHVLAVDIQTASGTGVYSYELSAFDGTSTGQQQVDLYLFGLDSDGDGLSDELENQWGASWEDTDSDGDGIDDFEESGCGPPVFGTEVTGATGPAEYACEAWLDCDHAAMAVVDRCSSLVDTDGDTLVDAMDDDSDGDGLLDADEALAWSEDPDADGLINVRDDDSDNDGVLDGEDNCWLTSNADQVDVDEDSIGDACDDAVEVPTVDAGSWADAGEPPYELEIPDASPPAVDYSDADGDGIYDALDNCPATENPAQTDEDYDGIGNACDDDDDNDGAGDATDNCPDAFNASQQDLDGDGQGDACDPDRDGDLWNDETDNCPYVFNPLQSDWDDDGTGDACDGDLLPVLPADGGLTPEPGTADAGSVPGAGPGDGGNSGPGGPGHLTVDAGQPYVNNSDADEDGLTDAFDNCPSDANFDQADSDRDGRGDVCDDDVDGDGSANGTDNCVTIYNPEQTDLDSDGAGDACDLDGDGDGVANLIDNCPYVPNASQADSDNNGRGDACTFFGFGPDGGLAWGPAPLADGGAVYVFAVPDAGLPEDLTADQDGDGYTDATDNCPSINNADQLDADFDGTGDLCDSDRDGDGHENTADNCAAVFNPAQSDLDGDGLGDACDLDRDGDGVVDAQDNCPFVPNPAQEDALDSGVGDKCNEAFVLASLAEDGGVWLDAGTVGPSPGDGGFGGPVLDGGFFVGLQDEDGDGVSDLIDNCAEDANPDQSDTDGDGRGDACDADDDNDSVEDGLDNCVAVYNPTQADLDEDGLGDACDPDRDGDGLPDENDNCPYVPNEDQQDADGDGLGDACTQLPAYTDAGTFDGGFIFPGPGPVAAGQGDVQCSCNQGRKRGKGGLGSLLLGLILVLNRRKRWF